MNRKRIVYAVVLLSGFFQAPGAEAQVAPSGISVHIEPQHLYMGGLKTEAEWPLKNNLRVATGLYTYFGKPYREMLRDSVTYNNFSGWGFSIMPKLYLARTEREFSNDHFYLAVFAGYRQWRADVAEFNWAEVQRTDQLYYLEFYGEIHAVVPVISRFVSLFGVVRNYRKIGPDISVAVAGTRENIQHNSAAVVFAV